MPKIFRTPQFEDSNPSTSAQAVFMTDDEDEGPEKAGICYCGKERNLNITELLCAKCNGYFHESCISYQLGKLVPFSTNYVFVCKNCSSSGLETFRKSQATISQMCLTAIANLMQSSLKEGKEKCMFSNERDIIPFIGHYWEALTTVPRRITQSWHSTVLRSLLKDVGTHFVHEAGETEDADMFGLVVQDVAQIGPNYEAMNKAGAICFKCPVFAYVLLLFLFCSCHSHSPKNESRCSPLFCC